jgi:hypothetical protein
MQFSSFCSSSAVRTGVLCAAVLVAGCLAGRQSVSAEGAASAEGVLRARGLEIVDATGRVRVEVGESADTPGTYHVQFWGAKGEMLSRMQQYENGAEIQIVGGSGAGQVWISSEPEHESSVWVISRTNPQDPSSTGARLSSKQGLGGATFSRGFDKPTLEIPAR